MREESCSFGVYKSAHSQAEVFTMCHSRKLQSKNNNNLFYATLIYVKAFNYFSFILFFLMCLKFRYAADLKTFHLYRLFFHKSDP